LQGLQQGVDVNQFEGLLRHHLLLLLILGGAVALFVLRLTGRLRRTWLVTLTLGLIVLNLFTVNWQFNLAAPSASGPFPETGLVSFLKAQPGTFRISSAGLLPGGASAGIVYEIEDITGNTPLRLDRFEQFEEGVGSWRRWQLLNVAYVLSDRDLDGPGLERVYEEDEVKVYRVGDPLPRAWVVYDVQAATDAEALTLLNSDEFHPSDAAVIADDSALASLPQGGGPGSPARVIENRPGRLVLDVTAGSDGLLVVSQPFYPGWRATVDGEAVPIFRVDYLLQGVEVPAGSHQVELAYRLSLAPAIVSLVVLLACLVGVWAYRRRA
ncbi:MAG: YfhO family protein, partial [Anaerolineae bacterium]